MRQLPVVTTSATLRSMADVYGEIQAVSTTAPGPRALLDVQSSNNHTVGQLRRDLARVNLTLRLAQRRSLLTGAIEASAAAGPVAKLAGGTARGMIAWPQW